MLIYPTGLLLGDRIARCSDDAQLHFPRLLAASNDLGRLQLSYTKLMASPAYQTMKSKPTIEQMRGWFREYNANFLLFVYQDSRGGAWGHWEMPAKSLPRHPKKDARDSPTPPEEELKAFRNSYIEFRKAQQADFLCDSDGFDDLPVASGQGAGKPTLPDFAESREVARNRADLRETARGVGVGEGVGGGERLAPSSTTQPDTEPAPKAEARENDPRHITFRAAVKEHWKFTADGFVDAPWDGSEGKALANLLKACPSLDLDTFKLCLRHRGMSDVVQTERPRAWIPYITEFLNGPLDRFGRPKDMSHGASRSGGAGESAAGGRNRRSAEAIGDAFERYAGAADADADDTDEGGVPAPGARSGDGGDVGAGMAGAGGTVWSGGAAGRAAGLAVAVAVLSPPCGTGGGAGGYDAAPSTGVYTAHAGRSSAVMR